MLIISALACILSLGYLLVAYSCVGKFHQTIKSYKPASCFQPPVTIFKPVCGPGYEMRENLRSFCEQNYPEYQIIFGVHDENDPAMAHVRGIIAEYPDKDITLVINQRLWGRNYKVSNLANMYPSAKHGILIIADDDMRVPGNYLNTVVAPLADHRNGAVTCLYSGSPRGGIVSTLIAMFINEWFMPSVLVSQFLKNNSFCFGATMVVRRDVLAQIGGFTALADCLADDYMLGKLVAEHGYKIHLSHLVIENIIYETSFKSMFLHELRWARTMRTVQPLGYLFTFFTDTLMIGFLAGITAYLHTQQLLWPVIIIGSILWIRALLHLRLQTLCNSRNTGSIWLIPVRDCLTFFIRLASFTGNRIEWKDKSFSINNTGLMTTSAKPQTDKAQANPESMEPGLNAVNTNTTDIYS